MLCWTFCAQRMSAEVGPTPQTTLAVIFGASRWPDAPKFEDAPSFERSADELISFLRDPKGVGLPWRNIKSLFDSLDDAAEQLDQAASFIERHRRLTAGTDQSPRDLLVLYVGHGDFEGEARDFYLSIRRTNQQRPLITSITARELGNLIRRSAGDLRTYLIIDCCFAAALQYGFMTSPLGLAELKLHEALPPTSLGINLAIDEVPTSGVALLAAAGLNKPALAPSGQALTAFTTALLDVLNSGHTRLGPRLTLQDIHLLVERRVSDLFPDASRPEMRPLQQSRGRVELLPFFPNPAFEAGRRAEERRKAEQAEATRLAGGKAQGRAGRGHPAGGGGQARGRAGRGHPAGAEERRKAEQAAAARLAEERRKAEQAEAPRLAERRRKAERAEATRLAEERRKAEQAEATRLAEERRKAEQAEATRLAEERRKAEQAEATRLAEERRKAEQAEA